ncbi:MAG: ribose 5-phosphate isomerase B [Proteobacteria bacterium]|nr:ribose 5-phosphate isomerase B [Pseudomonadota bacterium]
MSETVAIASDHAGVELKEALKGELKLLGLTPLDLGTTGPTSVDYPDFANALAEALKNGKAARGVLICGSGIGISIAANRHKHIRAALCHNEEVAVLSRQHNDANVLALGARVVSDAQAKKILRAFFTTDFEGGRHARRVEKMS